MGAGGRARGAGGVRQLPRAGGRAAAAGAGLPSSLPGSPGPRTTPAHGLEAARRPWCSALGRPQSSLRRPGLGRAAVAPWTAWRGAGATGRRPWAEAGAGRFGCWAGGPGSRAPDVLAGRLATGDSTKVQQSTRGLLRRGPPPLPPRWGGMAPRSTECGAQGRSLSLAESRRAQQTETTVGMQRGGSPGAAAATFADRWRVPARLPCPLPLPLPAPLGPDANAKEQQI